MCASSRHCAQRPATLPRPFSPSGRGDLSLALSMAEAAPGLTRGFAMRMFCRRCLVLLCGAFAVLVGLQAQAMAGVRLALVLGNGDYQVVGALANPANDAADISNALRGMGFEVIEARDASREAMARAIRDFSNRLRGADVALFFYAGHGMQMNGENYLLPVD